MLSTSFFDLCPDVLLELFEYFSLNELFDIFIDLIPYLLSLLNQSHMKLYIDRHVKEDFWNRILPQINSKQIFAIQNFPSIDNLSTFSALRSINLTLQSSAPLNHFQSLIYLERLSIRLSEIIMADQTWLSYILTLPKLKKLKLSLTISKPVLIPQQPVKINNSIHQSTTIESLEMKIPMSWQSLLYFLHHFPNLKIFRASLYQLNTSRMPRVNLSSLPSLRILDLQGYIDNMSSIISTITSSMLNLKHCRLIALNVTTDDAFRMRDGSLWKDFFRYCSNLIHVQIHLLMSIEMYDNFYLSDMKDLLRLFNNNSFCEEYHFRMEQLSINRGYITLTGDYQKKK